MTMTPAGWLFMILAWGIITSLAVYCFSKVLKAKPKPDDSPDGPALE